MSKNKTPEVPRYTQEEAFTEAERLKQAAYMEGLTKNKKVAPSREETELIESDSTHYKSIDDKPMTYAEERDAKLHFSAVAEQLSRIEKIEQESKLVHAHFIEACARLGYIFSEPQLQEIQKAELDKLPIISSQFESWYSEGNQRTGGALSPDGMRTTAYDEAMKGFRVAIVFQPVIHGFEKPIRVIVSQESAESHGSRTVTQQPSSSDPFGVEKLKDQVLVFVKNLGNTISGQGKLQQETLEKYLEFIRESLERALPNFSEASNFTADYYMENQFYDSDQGRNPIKPLGYLYQPLDDRHQFAAVYPDSAVSYSVMGKDLKKHYPDTREILQLKNF